MSRSYSSGAFKRIADCERKKNDAKLPKVTTLSSHGYVNLSKVFKVEVR